MWHALALVCLAGTSECLVLRDRIGPWPAQAACAARAAELAPAAARHARALELGTGRPVEWIALCATAGQLDRLLPGVVPGAPA